MKPGSAKARLLGRLRDRTDPRMESRAFQLPVVLLESVHLQLLGRRAQQNKPRWYPQQQSCLEKIGKNMKQPGKLGKHHPQLHQTYFYV